MFKCDWNFHPAIILKCLVISFMPYYRVLIWTKRRKLPYNGIRLIGDSNINAVQQMMNGKAFDMYRQDLIDVEVQMLSKLCTAVKEFETKAIKTDFK